MRQLWIKGREAAAVQVAAQQTSRFLHALNVKRLPPNSRGIVMQGLWQIRKIIAIGSPGSIKSGVEIVGNRLNPDNYDVVWKQSVEASAQAAGIDRFSCIKMGALTAGVYSCISPAGACDVRGRFQGYFQRFLYALLYA